MKLKLPDIYKLPEVDHDEDPLRYYKTPGLNWFYFKRLELAVKVIKEKKFHRLLDLGYGSGMLMHELSSRCGELYGIDKHGKSAVMADVFRKEGVAAKLYDADIMAMPFEKGYFDCVTCISVLDHLKELDKASGEIYRVLKKNGVVVIGLVAKNKLTDFVFRCINAKTDVHHVSTPKQIVDEFSRKFVLKGTYRFPAAVPKGLSLYNCWEFVKER